MSYANSKKSACIVLSNLMVLLLATGMLMPTSVANAKAHVHTNFSVTMPAKFADSSPVDITSTASSSVYGTLTCPSGIAYSNSNSQNKTIDFNDLTTQRSQITATATVKQTTQPQSTYSGVLTLTGHVHGTSLPSSLTDYYGSFQDTVSVQAIPGEKYLLNHTANLHTANLKDQGGRLYIADWYMFDSNGKVQFGVESMQLACL